MHAYGILIFFSVKKRLGGRRAFTGCPRLAEVWPSGLAVAPKVASAPRGPGSATLAGNRVQSLPPAPSMEQASSIAVKSNKLERG